MLNKIRPPEELKHPRVVVNTAAFVNRPFIIEPRVGPITDFLEGTFPEGSGIATGIVGLKGAAFVDSYGLVKHFIPFNMPLNNVNFVDVDRRGVYEYFNRGNWAINPGLVNMDGTLRWRHAVATASNDMAAGDVDGDGGVEFAIGYNGAGGISLLDKNGVERWTKPGVNIWHVEIVDTNGDGKGEIVHSNSSGEIVIRNGDGIVLSKTKPKVYFSHFSLCRWPDRNGHEYLVTSRDGVIYLLDFNGTVVARFDAPKLGGLSEVKGAPVKLRDGQDVMMAFVADYATWDCSVVYVYDAKGQLVYQEILSSGAKGLAVRPREGGLESLLIGGDGKVWDLHAGG